MCATGLVEFSICDKIKVLEEKPWPVHVNSAFFKSLKERSDVGTRDIVCMPYLSSKEVSGPSSSTVLFLKFTLFVEIRKLNLNIQSDTSRIDAFFLT